MSSALLSLAYAAIFAAVMWLPYILAAFVSRGLFGVLGYPDDPKPLPGWAARAKRAHQNYIENLAPFAALVLVAELSGADAAAVGLWASVFLVARLAHWVVFILKIPVLRTLAFLVGFGATAMVFNEILKVAGYALPGLPVPA